LMATLNSTRIYNFTFFMNFLIISLAAIQV
jgi:hypothetical protein